MGDFRAAIAPVLAIEGLPMPRFANSIWMRAASAAGKGEVARDRS
jgi:hypothetical protein